MPGGSDEGPAESEPLGMSPGTSKWLCEGPQNPNKKHIFFAILLAVKLPLCVKVSLFYNGLHDLATPCVACNLVFCVYSQVI